MAIVIKENTIIYFTLFFVLLSSGFVYAHGTPPTASNVIIAGNGTINLTENATTSVVVTTTITDSEGCGDITGVTVKFYKTITGVDAVDDENNHYTQAASLVPETCFGSSTSYAAAIPVWYYADPAEWTAQVIPTDGTEGAISTSTVAIDTLIALSVTDAIDQGELVLGTDTGIADKTTQITNTGNVGIGVQVNSGASSTAMTCNTGTISVENEKYSTSTGVAYALRTALTDLANSIINFSIAQRTGEVSTNFLYWGLGMPIEGVGGICTGKVVFTPIIL